uniref:Uncharacterized protein n=1 Tax=Arundo donax TaxID=35708 RepID=A0A0A9HES9_ARUDO
MNGNSRETTMTSCQHSCLVIITFRATFRDCSLIVLYCQRATSLKRTSWYIFGFLLALSLMKERDQRILEVNILMTW